MKILYGIAGMGNGHISRAKQLIPYLKQYGEVDILVAGTGHNLDIGYPVKYAKKGITFALGKKGGIDYIKSIPKIDMVRFFHDVRNLPVENYDLIISDFEPITAWACQYKWKKCVSMSNMLAFLSFQTPRPLKVNLLVELIFKYTSPGTRYIGIHYKKYDEFITTPLISPKIRNTKVTKGDHYTVYLTAYADQYLASHFEKIPDAKWEIFSTESKEEVENGNVKIRPINEDNFVKSMASAKGLIVSGGFQTAAECLYLGKKTMVVPIAGQYEQECNAVALRQLGLKTIKKIDRDFVKEFANWESRYLPIRIDYPDNIQEIVKQIMDPQNINH